MCNTFVYSLCIFIHRTRSALAQDMIWIIIISIIIRMRHSRSLRDELFALKVQYVGIIQLNTPVLLITFQAYIYAPC